MYSPISTPDDSMEAETEEDVTDGGGDTEMGVDDVSKGNSLGQTDLEQPSPEAQTVPQPSSEVVTVPETPTCITVTPPTSNEPSTENPLVAAGLIPTHLSDIFCTPHHVTESKPKRRRITARVLTENEYYDLLKKKDRKDKEDKELKQKRKEERERKKKEKEEEKKKKEMEVKKGKGKKRKKRPAVSPSTSSQASTSSRHRQLPARFQDSPDSGSDTDDSGILSALCDAREPEGLVGEHVLWIDCDQCGTWFHMFCTRSSKKYVCASCK